MNPEERQLLERTLKLSEENNQMLLKIEKRARWTFIWGFVKVAIVIVPLILGYLVLQPYIGDAVNNYKGVMEVFNSV